jgi:hypothetical protein
MRKVIKSIVAIDMAQMLQTINANRSTLTPGKVAISPAFAADE